MKFRFALGATLVLLLAASGASGADKKKAAAPPDEKAMMEMMTKVATPGEHHKKLKDAYFERHKKAISRGVQGLAGVLTGNEGGFSAAELEQARAAKTTLLEKYGYREDSARDLVVQMARMRYR